MVYQARIKWR